VSFLEVNADVAEVATQLRRIADALEFALGLQPREGSDKLPSAVMYHDDERAVRREIERDIYRGRTGITLAEDEDIPVPPAKDSSKDDSWAI
jgi:hypothetical protein